MAHDDRRRAARSALARLRRAYPPRHAFLDHETPFQLLVAVMLSAQSRDEMVNRVTKRLFARWPDAPSLARAAPEEVEPLLHGVQYAPTKARRLVEIARRVRDDFGGEVPRSLEDLTSLPGVGNKTASVVQGYVWGAPEMVAVDTHVKRVAHRLALTDERQPDRVAADLGALYAPKQWADVNYYFIIHGRRTCQARRPECGACPLASLCPKRGVLQRAEAPRAPSHPAVERRARLERAG